MNSSSALEFGNPVWRLFAVSLLVPLLGTGLRRSCAQTVVYPAQPVKERSGHFRAIHSLRWNRTGALLASAGLDRRLVLWDWKASRATLTHPLPAGASAILGWGTSNTVLVDTGVGYAGIVQTDGVVRATVPGRSGAMALSPSSERLAVPVFGSGIAIRSAESGALERVIACPRCVFDRITWSPDSKRLVATNRQGGVSVFDTATEALVYQDSRPADRASWSPDGRICALGATGEGIRFLGGAPMSISDEVKSECEALKVEWSSREPVFALFTGGANLTIERGWPRRRVRDLRDPDLVEERSPPGLLWSPDGTMLTVLKSGGFVAVWNIRTGERVASPGCETGFFAAAWHPSSRFMVLGDREGTIWTWEVRTRHTARRFAAIPEPPQRPLMSTP